MKKTFRYNTILMYGSLQSVGHTMDYFIHRTKKLVIFIVMPRVNKMSNLLKVYERGVLKEERNIPSSENIVLYYLLWWYYHNVFLLRYFSRSEHFLVLAGHPIAFMGMSIMKTLRRVTYAYWIGDYFPPVNMSLILFEKVKKYYHDRVAITYYLGDRINHIMNGSIVRLPNKRTVMWGMQPSVHKHKKPGGTFRLLFVGVIRPSQGMDDVLEFLRYAPDVYLSIVGICEQDLFARYTRKIKEYKISKQVWFPNRFVNDDELLRIAHKHQIGIAMYEKGMNTATHYTDPGKIKTYMEMGLPVVMTNTSAIAPFIKKYKAGIAVNDVKEVLRALQTVKEHYTEYQKGVMKLSSIFHYETYYKKSFISLENV